MSLYRKSQKQTVAVTAALATTEAILWDSAAGGAVVLITGKTTTDLDWYGKEEGGDEFCPIYDVDEAQVKSENMSAPEAREIPAACFAFSELKAVSNAGESIVIVKKG